MKEAEFRTCGGCVHRGSCPYYPDAGATLRRLAEATSPTELLIIETLETSLEALCSYVQGDFGEGPMLDVGIEFSCSEWEPAPIEAVVSGRSSQNDVN